MHDLSDASGRPPGTTAVPRGTTQGGVASSEEPRDPSGERSRAPVPRRGRAPTTFPSVDDSRVHIFWDNSNIFIGARDTCKSREGELRSGDVRIDFQALLAFAADGRVIEQAAAVGSVPPGMRAVWDNLAQAGVEIALQERGAYSGKEQGVDEALRLAMMHTVLDYPPAVCVLLTGDGDFFPEVDRMLKRGWGVEVLSFDCNLGRTLRQISTGYHGRGRFVRLDDWYEQIVFLKGGAILPERPLQPLDRAGRPRV